MNEQNLMLTRRQLLGRSSTGIGSVALASLLNDSNERKTRDLSVPEWWALTV